jgi:putative ABC transport system permease protein
MILRRFTHRTKKDEDRDEDIGPHLAQEQDAHAARGLSPLEPRRQARPRFGNFRATRGRFLRYQSFFWRDLRCAGRSLARTPGFTTVALLVIAAGIGVNTAVFSVVDAVLLKPLTYPDPQALVQLVTTSNQGPIPVASIPEYNIWQQQSNIFQQVAAYDWGGAGTNLTGGDYPEQAPGIHVTGGYFALFGAPGPCRTHFHRKERTGSPSAHYMQCVHALAVTTGLEKFGGPVDIKAERASDGSKTR